MNVEERSRIFAKIGEELATQLAQASKVASSRSNSLLEEESGRPKVPNISKRPIKGCVSSNYNPRTKLGYDTRLKEDMTGQIREELRTQIKEELRTQLEEENKRSLEIMTNALKEAIKKELPNKGSPELLQIQPDIQQVGARVSTQGSNVVTNVQASQEHHANAIPLMGLYVQLKDGTTRLVAMGKIMEGDSIIHTVAYADDVVRVSVETVIDPEAEVSYATSEIQYVKQVVDSFVAWPTHLVKVVLDEDPQSIPHNEDAHVPKSANEDADDPLRGLIKYIFDIYDNPLEINFDGSFLGIVDASASIFITYSDVSEIIAGDKSLNISVIQLWLIYSVKVSCMHSLSHSRWFVQRIDAANANNIFKDGLKNLTERAHWQLVVLCPRQHVVVWFCSLRRKPDMHIKDTINSVMTKLKTTLSPETKAVAPKWIEVKWFANDTPLDIDIITTIRKKWATFFLKTAITIVPPSLALQQLSEQMKCPQSLDGCLVELLVKIEIENIFLMSNRLLIFSFLRLVLSCAISNMLPTMTFVMAAIFRMEKLNVRKVRCQPKVIGTVVTVVGAMLMTLYKGQVISFFGSKYMHHPTNYVPENNTDSGEKDWFKGSVLLVLATLSWASSSFRQAVTLRKYTVQLSLTALVCALGITYYVQGIVMQKKGPVFVTAFSPLMMIIVAIMGAFILAEKIYLGGVIRAIVIVMGLHSFRLEL
ncbi:WAT1-related protein [Glycine soja]|uniref:WAT1-related protein n=1 Tax=Glycine soja TaxID=3848 RepID=A0A445G9M1_GLYSO|nr:WAT1-related protein [Glycine soja]